MQFSLIFFFLPEFYNIKSEAVESHGLTTENRREW